MSADRQAPWRNGKKSGRSADESALPAGPLPVSGATRLSLDDVLATEELSRRPSRPPDYAAENQALIALAEAMSGPPKAVLQKLVSLTLELCRAGSAGISILEQDEGNEVFRWHAIAGQLAANVGGGIARDASPCGISLERNQTLLFSHPERHFTISFGVDPPIVEALLVPFHFGDTPIGTVWVIAHSNERKFDSEDARMMRSLAKFAAGAAHALSLARADEALRQSQERLSAILEQLPVGVGLMDRQGQMVLSNSVMRGFVARLAPWRDPERNRHWQARAADGRPLEPSEWPGARALRGETVSPGIDFIFTADDGRQVWTRVAAAPFRDARGNIDGAVSVVQDIDRQKRAEAALRESEERFRLMADHAPVLIWLSGVDKLCTWFNKPWLEFTGRTMEQELGDGWTNGVHPDDLQRCLETYAASFDARAPFTMDYRLRRHDGEWRWMLDNGIPRTGAAGEFAGYIGSCIDITEHKRLEREVLEVATLEQRRIGQALHDSTGQELTALGLITMTLTESLQHLAPVAVPLADKIAEGLKRALGQVRAYSRGLIPVEVDSRGLCSALSELASRTGEFQGLSCTFSSRGAVDVADHQVATHLYHIAQEAVTNALRHGKSRQIAIQLEGEDTKLILRVTDDGVGFLPEAVNGSGIGLRIMRYRAGLIQGRLTVERATPTGTAVTCTLNKRGDHRAQESAGK